jgi:adenine-specific DNA-methyltransferase
LQSGAEFDRPNFVSIAAILAPRQRQGELGQFLTPTPVAAFMASLFGPLPEVVRLLDAGAGAGALTAGFFALLRERNLGCPAAGLLANSVFVD